MAAGAPRVFIHLDDVDVVNPALDRLAVSDEHFSKLCDTVRQGTIGRFESFLSPFGTRRITYADYVASGRALKFIESYIETEVLPMYGNTHTTSSATGLQSTLYRNEARAIIGQSCNTSKDDCVLFTGSGATGAIKLLSTILMVAQSTTVVFTGPFEHHSNLLVWREAGATLVTIPEDPTGEGNGIDLVILGEQLDKYSHYPMRIGAFSAASNITGVLSNTKNISAVLNAHGALGVFDFACAAPYCAIDMNPEHDPAFTKHAVFFSPHKLIGGISTPGVLVIKKHLMVNPVPTTPGGGTVFFVTEQSHRYLSNFVEREEGGTPDIVGSIRAAMAFDLRNAFGPDRIHDREVEICARVFVRWASHPTLVVLGGTAPRLPIFSFMIRAPQNSDHFFLHHNFVAALLNDLFGISARGGCACAGPYAQRLMGIDHETATRIEQQLLNKIEVIRPGFTRLNFAYFESDEVIEFLMDAVLFIANHGWRFLPDYVFVVDTGEWRHRSVMTKMIDRRWISHISYASGEFSFKSQSRPLLGHSDADLFEYIVQAHALSSQVTQSYPRHLSNAVETLSAESQALRWFLSPCEALQLVQGEESLPIWTHRAPIDPLRYHEPPSTVDESLAFPLCPTGTCPLMAHNQSVPQSVEETAPVPLCSNCFHVHDPSAQSTVMISAECLSCECVHYAPMDTSGKVANPAAPVNQKLAKRLLNLIVKKVSSAIFDFKMLAAFENKPGDRILVAVSGGKDSLTLVSALMEIRRRALIKFDIGACTVDPMTAEYDPSPLKKYFASLGVPYFYAQQPIMDAAKTCMRKDGNNKASICSFCARMKRGILYAVAREHGYNVLAMGQHLDDLAESFLMSAFHNSTLRTMKANYHVDNGDIRVIRPLVYLRERSMREYAKVAQLPVIFENCPACFEAPKERQRMKLMLAAQEHVHKNLFQCLLTAMLPLMKMENRTYAPPSDAVTLAVEDNADGA